MKILFISSEVVPFAKTGGLADVAGALPKALKNYGHDIRIALPKYRSVDAQKFGLRPAAAGVRVQVGDDFKLADIYETNIPGTDLVTYFVDQPKYFDRDGLYQEGDTDYPDNAERFVFFCRAILQFIKQKGWEPHIIHCNDWQAGLIPCYLKTIYGRDEFLSHIATVYSIHNVAYQGLFPKEKIAVLGLDEGIAANLVLHGQISLAKAGIYYADYINTVSEGYAREIQTAEFGFGLEEVLRQRSADLFGILNGVDFEIWDPEHDYNLKKKYSRHSLAGKAANKKHLQKTVKLPTKRDVPLIGIVSRLADQKGFDLIVEIMERLMQSDIQLVILGTGEKQYHLELEARRQKYSHKLAVILRFDPVLAPLLYAGCDMFLMPSMYEPCGLGQLISFRYGTIPIVRRTGGLADTVSEFDIATAEGNGFVFEKYAAEELLQAIGRALAMFKNKKAWSQLMQKVMAYDFSWDRSAKLYSALYKKAWEKKEKELAEVCKPISK